MIGDKDIILNTKHQEYFQTSNWLFIYYNWAFYDVRGPRPIMYGAFVPLKQDQTKFRPSLFARNPSKHTRNLIFMLQIFWGMPQHPLH